MESSSPEMPHSNGMVESTVKQIICIIRKCNNENSDPYLAILYLFQFKMGIVHFKMGIVQFKMGIVHFKMGIVQFKMEKLL